MVNADTTYLRQMQQQWGYSAAWLPTTHFELGAYGTMDGKEFEKLGTINKWVVPKSTSRPSGTMYYVSTGDTHVSVDFGAADITKQMGVDINIRFDKKSSIFFLAQDTTTISTQNLEQVGDKIVDVYKRPGNDWKLSYRWVTELVRAEFLTVLIALESNVSVTLSGKMPITYQGVPVAQLDLRNLSLTKGMSSVSSFQGPDATPLLSLFRVKDPITKKAFYTEYK